MTILRKHLFPVAVVLVAIGTVLVSLGYIKIPLPPPHLPPDLIALIRRVMEPSGFRETSCDSVIKIDIVVYCTYSAPPGRAFPYPDVDASLSVEGWTRVASRPPTLLLCRDQQLIFIEPSGWGRGDGVVITASRFPREPRRASNLTNAQECRALISDAPKSK